MKIMGKIIAWQQVGNTNEEIYKKIQKESVAAVIGGIESEAWKKFMKRFHSNAAQLQRLLGNDNLDPEYKDTVLAYIAGGGVCGGGTLLSLPIGMPDTYKAALDSDDLSSATDNNDGSDPMPLPEDD